MIEAVAARQSRLMTIVFSSKDRCRIDTETLAFFQGISDYFKPSRILPFLKIHRQHFTKGLQERCLVEMTEQSLGGSESAQFPQSIIDILLDMKRASEESPLYQL